MSDKISVTGVVASDPSVTTTGDGLAITKFRLASNQSKYDKAKNEWIKLESNFYSVSAFRQLATNAVVSLKKGDRVIVSGRLRVKSWNNGQKSGINIEIDADALGHDLSWGTASFSRSIGGATAETFAPSTPDNAGGGFDDAVVTVGNFGADLDVLDAANESDAAAATPF
jgi:single-strand DNA-binding protein